VNLTEGAESAVLDVEGTSWGAVGIARYWGKIQLSELIVLASADSLGEIVEVIQESTAIVGRQKNGEETRSF
jgi:hypothetical protein